MSVCKKYIVLSVSKISKPHTHRSNEVVHKLKENTEIQPLNLPIMLLLIVCSTYRLDIKVDNVRMKFAATDCSVQMQNDTSLITDHMFDGVRAVIGYYSCQSIIILKSL